MMSVWILTEASRSKLEVGSTTTKERKKLELLKFGSYVLSQPAGQRIQILELST